MPFGWVKPRLWFCALVQGLPAILAWLRQMPRFSQKLSFQARSAANTPSGFSPWWP